MESSPIGVLGQRDESDTVVPLTSSRLLVELRRSGNIGRRGQAGDGIATAIERDVVDGAALGAKNGIASSPRTWVEQVASACRANLFIGRKRKS